MSLEYTIYQRRNSLRRRRNIIRRIALFLSVIFFIFLGSSIYSAAFKITPDIQVINNKVSDVENLKNTVNNLVSGENLFLISPRKIRNELVQTNKLLKEVVVRKYIFPKYQLIVYIDEKKIWSEIFSITGDELASFFLTDEGNVIPKSFVDLNLLHNQLIPVLCDHLDSIDTDAFFTVRNVLDIVYKKFGLQINKTTISNDLELTLVTNDGLNNELLIKAGMIDNELFKRISRLEESLNLIRQKAYLVEYIDLTLENSVDLKRQNESKISIFGRRGKGL